MHDVQELLREKMNAVEQIRREVEALRLVTALLVDEGDGEWDMRSQSATIAETVVQEVSLFRSDAEALPTEVSTRGAATRAKAISHRLKRIAEPFLVTFVNSFRA